MIVAPPTAHLPLTRRQEEALRLAAEGLTRREIASRMRCSPSTVRAHIHGACRRLGVENRVDAWRALGWLAPPNA